MRFTQEDACAGHMIRTQKYQPLIFKKLRQNDYSLWIESLPPFQSVMYHLTQVVSFHLKLRVTGFYSRTALKPHNTEVQVDINKVIVRKKFPKDFDPTEMIQSELSSGSW